MSETSFGDGLGVHSSKWKGKDRKPEARPTPSMREVGGSAYKNKILKSPQTGGRPGIFLPERTKTVIKGGFIRKRQRWKGVSQRES